MYKGLISYFCQFLREVVFKPTFSLANRFVVHKSESFAAGIHVSIGITEIFFKDYREFTQSIIH